MNYLMLNLSYPAYGYYLIYMYIIILLKILIYESAYGRLYLNGFNTNYTVEPLLYGKIFACGVL